MRDMTSLAPWPHRGPRDPESRALFHGTRQSTDSSRAGIGTSFHLIGLDDSAFLIGRI